MIKRKKGSREEREPIYCIKREKLGREKGRKKERRERGK